MNYKMGFWTYVATGQLNNQEAIKDWENLGCNLTLSFVFDLEAGHDKQEFINMLDECHLRGIKVIVCDKRTVLRTYKVHGREEYKKRVKEAVADFGSHPATYGFFLGDEPDGNDIQNTIEAYKIVNEVSPELTHFINFLPIWYDKNDVDGFKKCFGVEKKDYKEYLDKIVKEAGMKCLGFDYYGQCNYFDYNNQYTKPYFENLSVYGQVARENKIPLFTSLLSVAHIGLRQVTQDDIRWQINTSVAMGTDGIFWFYLYERFLDNSFRCPPIDMFGAKTETYHWLARENKVFMKHIAPRLKNAEWIDVRAFNYDIPVKAFKSGDFGIKSISYPLMDCTSSPLLLTQFKDENGFFIMVVNADKRFPAFISLESVEESPNSGKSDWLSPGGIKFYRF